MALEAIFPGPNTSKQNHQHKVYPYLLKGLKVSSPKLRRKGLQGTEMAKAQCSTIRLKLFKIGALIKVSIRRVYIQMSSAYHVWATDITFIRLDGGFAYLVAIIDWLSRFVLSWRLSNSLESTFCKEAMDQAIEAFGAPEIVNTDQGCLFTSEAFTEPLKGYGIKISMDSKGRALDNIMIERLWRSVKYEEVYLKGYRDKSMTQAYKGLEQYFQFYNNKRPHQSLRYRTPQWVHVNEFF